jgi:hypothetical protein
MPRHEIYGLEGIQGMRIGVDIEMWMWMWMVEVGNQVRTLEESMMKPSL